VALIGIFLTRFIIEFVKVDQVAFEQGMTLNMGQWLSVPFILIGIASVWYALSHPAVADDSKKSNPKKR
jgi:prolipoprotein diacylglyceryltransferase